VLVKELLKFLLDGPASKSTDGIWQGRRQATHIVDATIKE
jgi:hypothetical protein